MKRSEIKRKTPLKAKRPMQKRKRKAQSAKQKDVRYRSERYLAFVRTLPCVVCGATDGIAAHHITGMYNLSGMGLKPADSFCMPACDPASGSFKDCHQKIHASKELQEMQPGWVKSTIRAGLEQFTGEDAEQLMHALAFIEAKSYNE